MKRSRNLLIYIVGLALMGAVPAMHLYAGELPPVGSAVAAADVHVREMTMTEVLGALSPKNVVVLTSMTEFRELIRLAVDKVSSP